MADKQNMQELVTYYYDPAGRERPALTACPACGGAGKVVLLISRKPCEACGGIGKLARAADGNPES